MIKVLLADDNDFALQYIRQLVDWEALGYEIVETAHDGEEAWEKYCLLNPQVVILDVQMPGKDGCKVAELIRDKNADTVILFLSNYDKFDYARAAINFSVQDYILKDELDEQMMYEKLLNIRKNLEEKRTINKNNSKNQLIAYFRMPFDELPAMIPLKEETYHCFIVEQDHIPGKITELLKVNVKEQEYSVLIADILKKIPQIEYLVRFEPYRWVGLCDSQENVTQIVHEIQTYLNKNAKEMFSVYLYGEASTIAECRRKYEEYRFIFEQRYFEGNEVFLYVDLCEQNKSREIRIEKLNTALDAGKIDETEYCMMELFQQILKEKNLNALIILIEEIQKIIFHDNRELYFETVEIYKATPHKLTSARPIMQCLRQQLLQYARYKRDIANIQSEETIKAIYYIEKNYQDSYLSVEKIAEVSGVSVTRLNELFKMKLNMTVGKFLTNQRMVYAEKLLRTEEMNITQVGEAVGYNSTAYFSKAFRKHFGVSPIEYRQKCRKE